MELSTDIIILLKSPTIGEALTPIRISAIPPALLQLAPGSDVRAEVLGRMVNGRTLMRVAGEVLTMELPESLTTADSVRMTFLGREPRPTFSLSLQQNSATPVAISQTGRWLGQIVQGDGGSSSRPEQLGRPARVSDGPPVDTARLAASLREALSTSGLFYESHLVEWAAGRRQLSSIMQEPQASLSPQPAGTPAAPLPAGNEQPAAIVAGATTETESAAPSSPPAPGSASAPQQPSAPQESPAAAPQPPEMPAATDAVGTKTPPGSGEVHPDDAQQQPAAPQSGRVATTPVAHSAGQPVDEPAVGAGSDNGTGTAPQPAGAQTAAIRPGAGAVPATATPGRQDSIIQDTAAAGGPAPPQQPSQLAEATPTRAAAPQQAGTAATAPVPAPQTPSQQQIPSQPVAGHESPPAPTVILREPAAAIPPPARDSDMETISPRQQPVSSPQKPSPPLQPFDQAAAKEMDAAPSALSTKVPHEATAGRTERPEVADPRAASIIREQLATLNSGMITWNGEAWPGQPLQWQIEDREARHRDPSEGRWHSELRVDLPNLGNVVASLKIRGKKLHLSLTADSGATTGLMQQEAPALAERLAAAGLDLENMVIRHGKKE